MKTVSTKMTLVRFEREEDGSSLKKFKVEHRSADTILDQCLTIEKDCYGRVRPSVSIDDFPIYYNEQEAVLKYADWLERLGIAIRREAKRSLKQGIK